MNYTFINYPKCSTCKKAKKFLDENKIRYSDKNIITEETGKINTVKMMQ